MATICIDNTQQVELIGSKTCKYSFIKDVRIGNRQNISYIKSKIVEFTERKKYWETSTEDLEISLKKIEKYNNFIEMSEKKIKEIEDWLTLRKRLVADLEAKSDNI